MPMSAEERDLMELQTQLLQQSVDATNAGNNLNNILMPILLEEQGYSVTRADRDIVNPEYKKLSTQRSGLMDSVRGQMQYFARSEDGSLRLSKEGRGVLDADKRRELERLVSQVNSVDKRLRATERYTQRTGDILGVERNEDPTRDLREENERLLLERQGAALRGELPVSPGLLSDLDQQEEDLRSALLERLGTGFETSTPGIEALAEFGERKNAILEATRRDDIAQAGGLANAMGGFLEGMNAGKFGRVGATAQMPFMNSSNLQQIVNSANGPLQFMQNNRALDFQISQANNAPGGLESLLYQGAGAASTFALANLFDI